MTLTTHHFPSLDRTVALPLALKAWVELSANQFCQNAVMLYSSQSAIVAISDEIPCAVITYHPSEDGKEWYIGLGYVLPEYRGQGVYTAVWEALVAMAQAKGVQRISSSTTMTNTRMRAVAAKQGRRESSVNLTFDVPPC